MSTLTGKTGVTVKIQFSCVQVLLKYSHSVFSKVGCKYFVLMLNIFRKWKHDQILFELRFGKKFIFADIFPNYFDLYVIQCVYLYLTTVKLDANLVPSANQFILNA